MLIETLWPSKSFILWEPWTSLQTCTAIDPLTYERHICASGPGDISPNPPKDEPHGGAKEKSGGHQHYMQFILWGTWISEPDFVAIHPSEDIQTDELTNTCAYDNKNESIPITLNVHSILQMFSVLIQVVLSTSVLLCNKLTWIIFCLYFVVSETMTINIYSILFHSILFYSSWSGSLQGSRKRPQSCKREFVDRKHSSIQVLSQVIKFCFQPNENQLNVSVYHCWINQHMGISSPAQRISASHDIIFCGLLNRNIWLNSDHPSVMQKRCRQPICCFFCFVFCMW